MVEMAENERIGVPAGHELTFNIIKGKGAALQIAELCPPPDENK